MNSCHALSPVSLIRSLLAFCLGVFCAALILPTQLSAEVFYVSSVADSGAGSLRAAIEEANAHIGTDQIFFQIPPAGSHTILLESELPVITDSVFIDGSTQPGFAGRPIVEVSGGAGADELSNGFQFSTSGSTLRGLVVNGFLFAIRLSGYGNTQIYGNWIGVDASGKQTIPHSVSILLDGSSYNRIGGPIPLLRNVIGGSISYAILMAGNSGWNVVSGNYIGVDPDGQQLAPASTNTNWAIALGDGSFNTIGGIGQNSGNVIAGYSAGVGIYGGMRNVVAGNFMGVSPSGVSLAEKPQDDSYGVLIYSGSKQNQIGGPDPKSRNVMGNLDHGIYLANNTQGNLIRGNYIGVFPETLAPIGNRSAGIIVYGSKNTIGGYRAEEANYIAFNGTKRFGPGVAVASGTGNAIYGNHIWGNSGSPIDLGNNGADTVHPTQPGVGSNNLQNYPVVRLLSKSSSTIKLSAQLKGTPNEHYRVEIYGSRSCLFNGFSEGQFPLGTFPLTADSRGKIATTLAVKLPDVNLKFFGATATDSAGNTSEISPCSNVDTSRPYLFFGAQPKYGGTTVSGGVFGVDPARYKIAIYIFVQGLGWYSKPYCNPLFTPLNSDGSWSARVVTGGIDNTATSFAAFLVPSAFTTSCLLGGDALPADVKAAALKWQVINIPNPNQRTISFSGLKWNVKSASVPLGPGPNYFSSSEQNVFVDQQGRLHLKITNDAGRWNNAEVYLTQSLGYGKYKFYLDSAVDDLDPNVVLGLFTWSDDGAYTHREIDVEFSRWGDANNPGNAQYVIQPFSHFGNIFRFWWPAGNPASVHSFDWTPATVAFNSTSLESSPEQSLQDWIFTNSAAIPVPGSETPRINLWLFNGAAPQNNQPAEVIIKRFEFEPH